MVVCEKCGGNCDHGELVQGICPECWEAKEKEKARTALLEEVGNREFIQIELDLEEGNGNSYDFSGKI